MPKPRHPLEERVRRFIADDPSAGPQGIRDAMERRLREQRSGAAKNFALTDLIDRLPSLSTIGRIKREFVALSPQEQREYRRVRWPDTFEAGLMPWEASRVVLDLVLAARDNLGTPSGPSLQEAQWVWRVYLAAPDLPADERSAVAADLVIADAVRDLSDEPYRMVQAYLAFAPWRGDELWERAIARGEVRRYTPGRVRESVLSDGNPTNELALAVWLSADGGGSHDN